MLKALIRTGVLAGFSYGVYTLARKYWGNEIDQALDKAKSTAKDIGKDLTRKDKAVTSSVEDLSRKAI